MSQRAEDNPTPGESVKYIQFKFYIFINRSVILRPTGEEKPGKCILKEYLHMEVLNPGTATSGARGDFRSVDKSEKKFGKLSYRSQKNFTPLSLCPIGIFTSCLSIPGRMEPQFPLKFPPFPLGRSDSSRYFRLQEGAYVKLMKKKLKTLENAILRLLGLE